MSADFWAGYLSGAVGIIIGNPLDILKVQSQAGSSKAGLLQQPRHLVKTPFALLRGSAAPVLGYGGLNALLFVTYNRSLKALDSSVTDVTRLTNVDLSTIWISGATGGLASWVISSPSELVKCRAQLAVDGKTSSLKVFDGIWKTSGLVGLYQGGIVTSLRDSIGYGFYFWSYELCQRALTRYSGKENRSSADVLVSGGIAGVVTWASIYPLDVVKTVLQTQTSHSSEQVSNVRLTRPLKTLEIFQKMIQANGIRTLYRGLGVCSVRAFIVNAVQWFTYEKIMQRLQHPA